MPSTILVVDDEPALLRLMEFLLARQGHTMLTATNGEEALEMIRAQRPDLVVLDIMMPRMDGYAVAETVRADSDPQVARIPIIMLSAKAQEADIERGLQAGVDEYITKPFSPDAFAEMVIAHLRKREQGDAGFESKEPDPGARSSA